MPDESAAIVELRAQLAAVVAGASEVRILFAFDPWRSAILLVAGDKAAGRS